MRSRPLQDILLEAKRLGEHGVKEVVLTGIHVSSYGKDLQQVGFTQIRQYGNRKLRPPRDGEERIFFTARKAETTE